MASHDTIYQMIWADPNCLIACEIRTENSEKWVTKWIPVC